MAHLRELMELCQLPVRRPPSLREQEARVMRAKDIALTFSLDLGNPEELIVDDKNPLMEACRTGNMLMVELFVTSGASLNILDAAGQSPLYTAIAGRVCSLKDIRKLLEWGSQVNLHKHGRLPLLASLCSTEKKISQLLIHAGADVNSVVLTSFFVVESVFSLNCQLVIVCAGIQIRHDDFLSLISLATDIVMAGLTPRTFYLPGWRNSVGDAFSEGFLIEDERLSQVERENLWKLQYLCVCLGFRVNLNGLQVSISSLREMIADEGTVLPDDDVLIESADFSVAGLSDTGALMNYRFDLQNVAGSDVESSLSKVMSFETDIETELTEASSAFSCQDSLNQLVEYKHNMHHVSSDEASCCTDRCESDNVVVDISNKYSSDTGDDGFMDELSRELNSRHLFFYEAMESDDNGNEDDNKDVSQTWQPIWQEAYSEKEKILTTKLSQLLWIEQMQAGPLPLTHLARSAIRAHLVSPCICNGTHINKMIENLPIPPLFQRFLSISSIYRPV